MSTSFDLVVVGGGHAGIEAAMAAAKLGCFVALVTMDFNATGRLSCNPSIGGSAKGHLVKEIDALGGVMARIADMSGLQFKTLNLSKGPAVWSPRSQNDNRLYPLFAQQLIRVERNISVIEDSVEELVVLNNAVRGVVVSSGSTLNTKTVVLCGGTFLNGLMYTGTNISEGGRFGERASRNVSNQLANIGLERGRLKTGTPPRVFSSSVSLAELPLHGGDYPPKPFSFRTRAVKNYLPCYLTKTVENTHDILRSGFDRSPMFSGLISGAGPRYCPSVEDKVFRFSDKPSHNIMLEPENLNQDTLYVNGFSTSLPEEVQQDALHSIPGLEKCIVQRFGYAVEYDFFFPYQLKLSLETKAVDGLFFAGQINGTSGYEEAASQGLVAGINAAHLVLGREPFTLSRDKAYIGVVIDDLVNKNTEEPYRIFTSLAEYRLLLRMDTAYDRLMPSGLELGLISEVDFQWYAAFRERKKWLLNFADSQNVEPDFANPFLAEVGDGLINEAVALSKLLRRPTVNSMEMLKSIPCPQLQAITEYVDVVASVQNELRYQGYISKQLRDVRRFSDYEKKKIPDTFDYASIKALSSEAREKLSRIRPASLGQASRIPGVSATDLSVLSVHIG